MSLADVLREMRSEAPAESPGSSEIGFLFLNLETEARIEALAKRFNVEPGMLITMALDALEDRCER